MSKKAEHEQIFKDLERISNLLPTSLYWLDTNNIILGANDLALKVVGGVGAQEKKIGHKHNNFYPEDVSNNLEENNNKVIQSGQSIEFEEKTIDINTGAAKCLISIRSPLRDSLGNIIGVVGASTDITAQKEAEQIKLINDQLRYENQKLEFESKAQKISAELDAYKKFKHIADQMAHDLGSPLMALSVLENSCAELPEAKRNMLKESISRIRDIAGSLLSQYRPIEENVDKAVSQEVLVYAALEQILMDKQYEYHDLEIKFESYYDRDSVFSFIEANPTSFKRMLSNLINNSVDAIESQSGKIIIKLNSNGEEVMINIIDTGKGMPESVISKLLNNISFTSGKENGRGIGYTQIHETLKQSNGKIEIASQSGIGTTITLTFPRIETPEWISEEIEVKPNDTVLILDDDNSIHGAWDIRFTEILKSNQNINLRHFKQADDAINFINSLTDTERKYIFLLTDYELLKQNLNGLDVISKTKIDRSILVTSHYSDISIRKQAYQANTKILPKVLASEIDINVV